MQIPDRQNPCRLIGLRLRSLEAVVHDTWTVPNANEQ